MPTNSLHAGLIGEVYKSADSALDCTNGGISTRFTSFVAIGAGVPEIFAPTDSRPALYLMENVPGHLIAHPHPRGNKGAEKWHMFGGNFLYLGDSRAPACMVPIHDRVE